jgi:hypothetical protein
MNEWNIQGRAQACQACGQSFADQQAYHTLLFDERSDYRRLDVCPACWEAQYSQGARERRGFVSYWQGIYEAPPASGDPIHKDTAEALLRRLIGVNDPRYGPAAYILAVMLERKRILKVKEQIEREGRRVFVYEQPRTGDLFSIADPGLRLDQLDAVQRDVAVLLEHGFPLPTLTAAAGASPRGPAEEAQPAAAGPPAEVGTPAPAAAASDQRAAPDGRTLTNAATTHHG